MQASLPPASYSAPFASCSGASTCLRTGIFLLAVLCVVVDYCKSSQTEALRCLKTPLLVCVLFSCATNILRPEKIALWSGGGGEPHVKLWLLSRNAGEPVDLARLKDMVPLPPLLMPSQ